VVLVTFFLVVLMPPRVRSARIQFRKVSALIPRPRAVCAIVRSGPELHRAAASALNSGE
jgi:hypothetical protein